MIARVLTTPLRRSWRALRQFFGEIRDRHLGVETTTSVSLQEAGVAAHHRVGYEPSPWAALKRILPASEVSDHDVFIDYGCGKGRVLLQAASYSFKRIIGLDVSPDLAASARRNVDQALPKIRSKDVEIVVADALEYEIPDDVSVVYFYNPFYGAIFTGVIDKMLASLRRRPRTIRIIYFYPEEEARLLQAGAVLVRESWGRRPTRQWSLANSIRMYTLGPPLLRNDHATP